MARRLTFDDVARMFGDRVVGLDAPAKDAPPSAERTEPGDRDTATETPRRALNKTEAAWHRELRVSAPASRIFPQPTRFFSLAGGGTYTPDFLEFPGSGYPIVVWEVKGGYRGPGWEQGYERWNRAALEWSDGVVFQFKMATREKGKWTVRTWKR